MKNKTRNKRLEEAKKKRNKAIRRKFMKFQEKHINADHAIEELADEYGLSAETIYAIIKQYGYYSDK